MSTVESLLASSTRITSSTTSCGISAYVLCRVFAALYAGMTTMIFFPFSMRTLSFLSVHAIGPAGVGSIQVDGFPPLSVGVAALGRKDVGQRQGRRLE